MLYLKYCTVLKKCLEKFPFGGSGGEMATRYTYWRATLMTQKFIHIWFLTKVNQVLNKKIPPKPPLIF